MFANSATSRLGQPNDWTTGWPTFQLANQLNGWQTIKLTGWLAELSTDWLPADRLTYWPTDPGGGGVL